MLITKILNLTLISHCIHDLIDFNLRVGRLTLDRQLFLRLFNIKIKILVRNFNFVFLDYVNWSLSL